MDQQDKERFQKEDREFFQKAKKVGLFLLYLVVMFIVGLVIIGLIFGPEYLESSGKWIGIGSIFIAYDLAFRKRTKPFFKNIKSDNIIKTQNQIITSTKKVDKLKK